MQTKIVQEKNGQSKCPICGVTKRVKMSNCDLWGMGNATISCVHYRRTERRGSKIYDIYE
jgi:hypothetical protein